MSVDLSAIVFIRHVGLHDADDIALLVVVADYVVLSCNEFVAGGDEFVVWGGLGG